MNPGKLLKPNNSEISNSFKTMEAIDVFRSQPIELSKEKLIKLGIEEKNEDEERKERKIIKTEIVDDMLDFSDHRITPFIRIRWFLRHISDKWFDIKWDIRNYFVWKKVISHHRPWDIRCFFPLFEKHLELYIDTEKRYGIAVKECRDYKIATAQEALDIIKRLLVDDYSSVYTDTVKDKWGKFPYEKRTYEDGSISFKQLTPEEYDAEYSEALKNAVADEEKDLKRLGEIIEKNMLDWWD